jgi:hypothetical protein
MDFEAKRQTIPGGSLPLDSPLYINCPSPSLDEATALLPCQPFH